MNKDTEVNHYSFWRIKRILDEFYNCRIENINQGYKANRRKGYVERYNLIDNETNTVIAKSITLHSLRKIFTEEGITLNDED